MPPDPVRDERYASYLALRTRWPGVFEGNVPGGIEVLTSPEEMAEVERISGRDLAARGSPTAWAKVGIAHEDQYVMVLRDAVRFPDGSRGTYIRILSTSTGRGVAILPVLDDTVVFIRHFRHATRSWHYEVPRGFGDVLDPAEDAVRELREELGAHPRRLEHLGSMHTDTGTMADAVELYIAWIDGVPQLETAEGIESFVQVGLADLAQFVNEGSLTDSFSLAAMSLAWFRGLLTPFPAAT